MLIFYALSTPWSMPYLVTEGEGTRDFAYARFPYADGARSHVRLGPAATGQFDKSWEAEEGALPPETQPYAAQLSTDGSYQLGGLWRTTLAARVQTPLRFELDSTYSFYVEPLADRTDNAWLGMTHLSYRFAQTESVQFHTGVGFRQFSDRTGTTFGVDFLYGFDVFWGKPFVSSVNFDIGNLGDAVVLQIRGTFGVTVGRFEIFGGYDHVAMKSTVDTRSAGVGLGGPILGLRLWL